MKDDTTRYPRTMVVFAIVMLVLASCAMRCLLAKPICRSLCSMKIISTIGYVVVGLTMAAVVGECMRRNSSFLSLFKIASSSANSFVKLPTSGI